MLRQRRLEGVKHLFVYAEPSQHLIWVWLTNLCPQYMQHQLLQTFGLLFANFISIANPVGVPTLSYTYQHAWIGILLAGNYENNVLINCRV